MFYVAITWPFMRPQQSDGTKYYLTSDLLSYVRLKKENHKDIIWIKPIYFHKHEKYIEIYVGWTTKILFNKH